MLTNYIHSDVIIKFCHFNSREDMLNIRGLLGLLAAIILVTGCSASTQPAPTQAPSSTTPSTSLKCERQVDESLRKQLEAAGYLFRKEWKQEDERCVQYWSTQDETRYVSLMDNLRGIEPAYDILKVGTLNPVTIEGYPRFTSLSCPASFPPHELQVSLAAFDEAVKVVKETKKLVGPDSTGIYVFNGAAGSRNFCSARE